MSRLRVLFAGGTGLISSACAAAVLASGHELHLITRGNATAIPPPAGAKLLHADVRDEQALARAVAPHRYDAVVQWVGFTPDQVQRDLRVFSPDAHYVYISSATVYRKPPPSYLVTEDTPRANPYWQYARDKIRCEDSVFAAAANRPVTVVRPSLTYGPSQIPVCVGSWDKPYTIVDRMRRGKPVLVPGDGTALWTLTHATDFAAGLVPLLANPAAYGEAFHVTSDEVLSWDAIYTELAAAVGVAPRLLHVPTDALIAAGAAEEGSLRGDKMHSTVFDLGKLRRVVPGFNPAVPFATGIRETIRWFDADPARRSVDRELDARWDRVAELYADALHRAAGG